MLWFWADSSNISSTLDVRSIFILSSTMDWYLEVRIKGRDKQYFPFFDPRDQEHKDLENIDLNVLRHAQYLHNAWNKHQDKVDLVDIDLVIRKGLTFSKIRSNAIISQRILRACCIPKVVRLKIGVQPTQPIPNPIRDRSGQLGITQDVIVVQDERKMSRSQEISVKFLTKNSVLQIRVTWYHERRDQCSTVHLKTARVSMLSRLMIDQGNLINTLLHYKMTLKCIIRPERSTPTLI